MSKFLTFVGIVQCMCVVSGFLTGDYITAAVAFCGAITIATVIDD